MEQAKKEPKMKRIIISVPRYEYGLFSTLIFTHFCPYEYSSQPMVWSHSVCIFHYFVYLRICFKDSLNANMTCTLCYKYTSYWYRYSVQRTCINNIRLKIVSYFASHYYYRCDFEIHTHTHTKHVVLDMMQCIFSAESILDILFLSTVHEVC